MTRSILFVPGDSPRKFERAAAGDADALLDRYEATAGVPVGGTQILPIATELGPAMFGLGTYAGSSSRLWGLTWGAEDLAADPGTVCIDLENDAVVVAESLEARRDGFTGKMAIHPKHVGAINAAFTPSAPEREWARKIVAAFDANPNLGTFRLEGKMIDRPHLRAARRVLCEG